MAFRSGLSKIGQNKLISKPVLTNKTKYVIIEADRKVLINDRNEKIQSSTDG